MKRTVSICFLLLCIFNGTFVSAVDLEYIREQYGKASTDKEVCKKIISELSNNTESDVHLAYLGAYQAMWANHTSNPFGKLSTFNEGKKNIEKAIQQSVNNVEIRFIRLSVQKNCPGFLGYSSNIPEDKEYLSKYKNTVSSFLLLKMINELLSQ